MRILRVRTGFQADHSSSSYLFYAVDKPVSAAGQSVAHRFSSRAEVDGRTAYYHKYGESELSDKAYPALLGEHYDVMVSESYDNWHFMMAVPKTPEMEALLEPFDDLVDEYQRMSVHDYGQRLVVDVYCQFAEDSDLWEDEDSLDDLAKLLAKIRRELLDGNVSFLQAVADFYGATADGEEEEVEDEEAPAPQPPEWSKAQLQEECGRRGIEFRKSWSKEQLRDALTAPAGGRPGGVGKPGKLSAAARRIVDNLEQR
jgi:hypothetical protein